MVFARSLAAMVAGNGAIAPLLSNGDSEGSGSTPRKYSRYDRLFLKHLNPRFAQDVQLALRAAVVVVVIGLQSPLLPGTNLKLFGAGAVVMFAFTIWKTVGETIFWAWCGIVGHGLAALDMYLLFWLFPEGNFVAGVLNGLVFTVLVLWLNLSNLAQQFAMANYVIYLMAFLSKSRPNIEQNLVWAIFGTVLAVAATLLPYPIWAIDRGREQARTIVAELDDLWIELSETFLKEDVTPIVGADIRRKMRRFESHVGSLDGFIKASWYECVGFTSRQRVRAILQKLDKSCTEIWERLKMIEHIMQMSKYAKEHDRICSLVAPSAMRLVRLSLGLLTDGVAIASRGRSTAEECAELQGKAEAVQEAMKAFTTSHRAAKASVWQGGAELLHSEAILEDAFGLNACALSRLCIEFGRFVADQAQHGRTRPTCSEVLENWGVFAVADRKVLFNHDHICASLLNAVSIICGFCLGYKGYAGIFPAFDAGIAATIALLMSKSGIGGSTLKKNLGRIQGVVLGTVVGQIGDALFRTCDSFDQFGLGLILFLWVFLTLFVRYNSDSYSMVGKLLAAFGAKTMIGSCHGGEASIGEKYNTLPGYRTIVNNCLSVFVIVAVEFFLFHERASDRAADQLLDAWDTLSDEIKATFSVEFTSASRDDCARLASAKLKKARALNAEASVEPRFWRAAWPLSSYERVVELCLDVDTCLHAAALSLVLEHDPDISGDVRPLTGDITQKVMAMDTWNRIRGTIINDMSATRVYLTYFHHESTAPMPLLQDKHRRFVPSDLEKLRTQTVDKVKKASHITARRAASLEHDAAARLSAMFVAADVVEQALKRVNKSIRRSAR